MLITDAQVHLWEEARPDRPWPVEPRSRPHRPHGFSAEEMLAEMDAAGVDRAVIVPPSWVGENNATALEAAARYPNRFAAMGRFDPRAPDAAEQLEGWLQQPHMLGIRMSFHMRPFSDWLDDGSLDWFWAACERLGIPVMILVPGIVHRAAPIAQRHPRLRLIVDHLGVPLQLRGAEAFAGLDTLLALAACPRLYVKVSSAPNFSNEAYAYRDLDGYLRRLYDAFGAKRLLWGADITRLRGSYRECLDHVREGLDFLRADDREWLLGRAAAE